MAIYTKSPPLVPKLPDIDLSQIAGRFGSMPFGPMEEVTDFNTAMVGVSRSTKAVPGLPSPGWPWGGLWTLSSEGSGRDGKRTLTSPLQPGEVVVQLWYSTDNVLYSRAGFGEAGFTPWQKRWG
ncbi:hypothetical protein VQ326_002286 [Salmonella enterica]|nr:hypothetical protein [Salmonella enterica]EMD4608296.1 hypothetical protein [Salmonella enterica]